MIFTHSILQMPERGPLAGNALQDSGLGALSALEASLAGAPDEARTASHAARARLQRLAQHARQAARIGAAPQEFAVLQSVSAACTAALEVLDSVGMPDDGVGQANFGISHNPQGDIS